MKSMHQVVYTWFLAETGPARPHQCDGILCAVVKVKVFAKTDPPPFPYSPLTLIILKSMLLFITILRYMI